MQGFPSVFAGKRRYRADFPRFIAVYPCLSLSYSVPFRQRQRKTPYSVTDRERRSTTALTRRRRRGISERGCAFSGPPGARRSRGSHDGQGYRGDDPGDRGNGNSEQRYAPAARPPQTVHSYHTTTGIRTRRVPPDPAERERKKPPKRRSA